jgi:UDP-GlcNAc:undecaprenyl-phosphate GlcNAc-1-phosphate transferase
VRTAVVAFLISVTVAAVLTPLVRRFALRFGLLDHVRDSRKIHGRPIPRVGGLAIMGGFYTPLVGLAIYETGVGQLFYSQLTKAMALMAAGLVIGALGTYDDVKGANARKKFTVQIAVAVALYFAGFKVQQLAIPFGDAALSLGPIALPFTVLWIVGVINAVNLIDGMDGLAGGVAFFAVGTTFMIAFHRNDALMMLFMACLGGSVLGFLIYNFNPASIFMGDTGSMFLGLILATSSIQTSQKSSTAVAILIPIIVLGLPIADTLLAMGRRALGGRPLFTADKEHIHHRLLALGLSQRKAVLVLYGASIVLATAALAMVYANSLQTLMILAFLATCFVAGMRALGYLRLDRTAALGRRRQRNRRLRAVVRQAGDRLADARDSVELWDVVRPLGLSFDAAALSLSLTAPGEPGTAAAESIAFTQNYAAGDPSEAVTSPAAIFSARFDLAGLTDLCGHLDLAWSDGRIEVDRDEEIAIEILCDHIAGCWRRLNEGPIHARRSTGNLTILRP